MMGQTRILCPLQQSTLEPSRVASPMGLRKQGTLGFMALVIPNKELQALVVPLIYGALSCSAA